MMKTKKSWFVTAVAVILSASLAGCIGEGSNTRDYEAVPSYVTMAPDGRIELETLYGNIYASGLPASTFEIYTYGISWFNVNYDQQPAGTDGVKVPYTADVNIWLPVSSGYLYTGTGELPGYYNDTILGASLYYSQLLNGHAFFIMKENTPRDRKYNYYLTCNTDSTTKYGVPMLYMQADITSPGSESTVAGLDCPYAFDMSSLLYSSYAKDSTIDKYDFRIVRFKLYYQSGVNKETNKPIFKSASDSEQLIFVPKDEDIW